MKALAVHTLRMGNETHAASTKDVPNIIDLDDEEYERLEELGAVRKPTKEETAVFDAIEKAKNTGVKLKKPEAVVETQTGSKTPGRQKSGAPHDPSGAPAGAKTDLDV